MATKHRPNLFAGDSGPAVKALQLCLRRSLGRHAQNRANGEYGTGTVRDVARFEKAHGVRPVSGASFGPRGWAAIERHVHALPQVRALLEEDRVRRAMASTLGRRRAIVAAAYWRLARSGSFYYRQVRPYAKSVYTATSADCSSFATLCYKAAGAPDPNGFKYNGYGFTGTLWARGSSVSLSKALPGDLVFYGSEGTSRAHVAVFVGGGQVITFGSYPISRRPVFYRADFRGIRTYEV